MTAVRPKSKTIDLKDLLAPRVQDIITKGSVFKDPQYSLYHTAREAIAWQNWMRERQLPMTGSPLEVVQQAARSLKLNSTDVERAIAKAGQEYCVPSAKFVDQGSDVSCWMRVAELNRGLFKLRCPPDIQLEALERMSQHRALNPKLAAQRDVLRQQKQAASASPAFSQQQAFSGAAEPAQDRSKRHTPDEHPANVPQIEVETGEVASPQPHLNTQLAFMGRQLVAEVGAQQEGQRSLDSEIGRAQYKITLNLADNTLRIYAQGRGRAPILIDANGIIDHANACVRTGDVAAFQAALDYLQRQRPSITGAER
jgi:hypothetical protein